MLCFLFKTLEIAVVHTNTGRAMRLKEKKYEWSVGGSVGSHEVQTGIHAVSTAVAIAMGKVSSAVFRMAAFTSFLSGE